VSLRHPLVVLALLAIPAAASAGPTKRECIRANEDAQDQRRAGKLVAAHQNLVACIAASCPGPIREDCLQRLHEVDAALPRLVFDVKDGSGKVPTDVRISDSHGRLLATRLDGTAIPVDPGPLELAFEGVDGVRTELTLVAHEGDGERHIPVTLGAPRTSLADAPVAAVPPPSSPLVSPSRDASNAGGTERTIGLILGGAGVASLVLGSVFAVVAKSTYDGAKVCPNACTGPGYQQGQSAYTEAGVATAGFVAGAALLLGGATLYWAAPRGQTVSVSPTVGSGGAGLGVRWRW